MDEIIKSENTQPISRTPKLIAAEINNIKEQTRKLVLYNSIEIGRRLIEAKSMLSHGEWGDWLKQSVDYSQSTANNLMRIFNEYGSDQITLLEDNSKSQALGNLSYTQAVALLGIPEEERENFVKENDIDNMSTRELQKAIKERDVALKEKEKALKNLEKAKDIASKKEAEAKKILEEKQKIEMAMKKSETEKAELEKSIAEIKEQLSKAETSGDSEEISKLQASLDETVNELINSNNKIAELEQKLKEKPIEVVAAPEIVEKIPEDIERELHELRAKASSQNDESVVKYTVYFNEVVSSFKNLLGSLAEIRLVDDEKYQKYKSATSNLIEKMLENL